ncbi:Glycosyltransferase involved in cell wall bisynthesis [Paenibacillaceae bacterium GAS479]|nr:Glycosyltransferase involved in cell wall bisynthesis [Paenibacillaceae bacterium GAS479]
MKPSIIIASSLYEPMVVGGAEISTKILAESLCKYLDVHVVTVGLQKNGIEFEEVNGIKIYRIPCHNIFHYIDKKDKRTFEKIVWQTIDIFNPEIKKEIIKLIKEIKPQIMHTQNMSGLSLSVWKAASDLKIPIVHTLRDYTLLKPVRFNSYSKIYRSVARKISSRVNAVIGISEFILDKYVNHKYFNNSSKFIVYNAVELNKKFIGTKKNNDSTLVIGCIGQLEDNKGVEFLVKAFKDIPHTVSNKLVIVGSGSRKQELENLAAGDNRIEFTGHVKSVDVYKLLEQFDLVVVPSIWEEPFGRVIIESYSMSVPVIGSDIGGIPEVIIKNEDFLFKPRDIDSIKKSINNYFEMSQIERESIRQACYIHSQTFTIQKNVNEHLNLYRSLITIT